MSAVIVPYVPPGYDDGRYRLMVECLECGIEWGWTLESSEYAKYLPNMAVEHNTRYHAREANVAKTMQEVLVEHLRTGITGCRCGWADLGRSHTGHLAHELEAAGYGLVADAKREAWDEGKNAVWTFMSNQDPRRERPDNPYREARNDDQ